MPDFKAYGKVRKTREDIVTKRIAAQEHEYAQKKSAERRKIASKKYYDDKYGLHEQVATAALQMLRQFIEEIKGKPLLAVLYDDKESVIRRKDQLAVMKETMSMLKMLKDLYRQLAEDYNLKEEDINIVEHGNVKLFMQAKGLLNAKGIKIPDDIAVPASN